jgi:branched-chain amino acid transport system permease protein
VSGSILSAGLLTVLPEALRELSDYRMIGYALILAGMMLFRPEGLFGLAEAWEVPAFRRFLGRGGSAPPQRPPDAGGDVSAGGAA